MRMKNAPTLICTLNKKGVLCTAAKRLYVMTLCVTLTACALPNLPNLLSVQIERHELRQPAGSVPTPGVGGYVTAQYPVPGTQTLTIVMLVKGTEIFTCAPGDTIVQVNTKPNAWISVNALKPECLVLSAQQDNATRYAPVQLPDHAVPIVNGGPANPYEAVPGTQYLVNARTQQRDANFGAPERLPLAITPDGHSCGNAIPVAVPQHPGRMISKTVIRCLNITRNGAELSEPR